MTAILELGGAIGARKGFDAPILPCDLLSFKLIWAGWPTVYLVNGP